MILALNAYSSHALTRSPGISEKVEVKHGEILIGMPIFMDDIAAIGGAEDIRKGIRNCRKIDIEKKMEYIWINKNKRSSDKSSKRYHRENRRGRKSWGKVKETDKVQYLGMVINSEEI